MTNNDISMLLDRKLGMCHMREIGGVHIIDEWFRPLSYQHGIF